MNLTLSTKPFIAELKAMLPVVSARPGLPMLSGIRLDASDEGLAIEATDLELTARRIVPADVSIDVPGSAVAPAKAMVKALAAIAEPRIELESETTEAQADLQIRAGTRTVRLHGWAAEDWPAVPGCVEGEVIASIETPPLCDAIERAALCASRDESRPVLTCVALCFNQDRSDLEVVATDSYRLGACRIPAASVVRPPTAPVLLPSRAVRLVAKRLRTTDDTARIVVVHGGGHESPERVQFIVPGADWTVRAFDGEFPNWRQVVPESVGGMFEFEADELSSALRAAASIRSRVGAPIRLSLDRTCSLALAEAGLGEMRQELAQASFTPDGAGALEVGLNPDYLADAMRFCGAERGRMWVRDALKPVLFEGRDRRYVLMPVRTH
jgi:DNA polymerase III subunit beta